MNMKRNAALVVGVIVMLGCGSGERARSADSADSAMAVAPAQVASVDGFSTPESVLWDADQGVWFVSNINGSPTAKDGNGFIARLRADGTLDSLHFVEGGRGGVTLNAPKGLALQGDTLWVADIDAVRGFDRHTGAPVADVAFGRQATFLNDIALGPDGTLYITDSGLGIDAQGQMTHPGVDRIFELKGRTVSTAAEGAWLASPNGIMWDPAASGFVVVPFGGTELLRWSPGSRTADTIGSGPGSQDGVVMLPDGRILVSSWADSTVFSVGHGSDTTVVRGVNSPADIGFDPARGWLGIPLFLENRVVFWRVSGPV